MQFALCSSMEATAGRSDPLDAFFPYLAMSSAFLSPSTTPIDTNTDLPGRIPPAWRIESPNILAACPSPAATIQNIKSKHGGDPTL